VARNTAIWCNADSASARYAELIPREPPYDAAMDKIRVGIAAAVAFLVAAVLVWRRSVAALVGGAALCAIYLVSLVTPGPPVFIAYWIVALVLTLQALPLLRR
jgi:hypothetical protein